MPARRLAVALIVLASLLPGHSAAVEGRVWRIEYAGRGLRDVRFSPTAKRGTSEAGATRASLAYYIDLTYPGPRGRFDTGAPDQRRGH